MFKTDTRPYDYDFGVKPLKTEAPVRLIVSSSATGPHRSIKIHEYRDVSVLGVSSAEHDDIKLGIHDLNDPKFVDNTFPKSLAERLNRQIQEKQDHSFNIPFMDNYVIDIDEQMATEINKHVDNLNIQNINTILGDHPQDKVLEQISKKFWETFLYDVALDPADAEPIDWTLESIHQNWTVGAIHLPSVMKNDVLKGVVKMLNELNHKMQGNIEFVALIGEQSANREATTYVNNISKKNHIHGKRTVFVFNRIGRKSVNTKHYNFVLTLMNENNAIDPILHASARPKTAGDDLFTGKLKDRVSNIMVSFGKYPARKYVCAEGQTQRSNGKKTCQEPEYYNKTKFYIFDGAKKRQLSPDEYRQWAEDPNMLTDLHCERTVMKLDLTQFSQHLLDYAFRAKFDGMKVELKGKGLNKSSTKNIQRNGNSKGLKNTKMKILNNIKNMMLLLGKSSADIRYMVDQDYKVNLQDCLRKIPLEQLQDRLGGMHIDIAIELAEKVLTEELQQILMNYER